MWVAYVPPVTGEGATSRRASRDRPRFEVRKRHVAGRDTALGWRMQWAARYGVRLLVVVMTASATLARPVVSQLVVQEVSLGARADEALAHTVEVSSAMRLGYVVATPAGKAVVVDGVQGPLYADIRPGGVTDGQRRPHIVFSPDGQRFAYLARVGDQVRLVLDGEPGPLFDAISWEHQPFSPDGRHVAYVASRDGQIMIVRDGIAGPAYDYIRDLRFTADSRHVVYTAQRDGRELVVMDDRELAADDHVVGLTIRDPVAHRVAYRVKKGDGMAVVVDGAVGKTYRSVGEPLFSPDGRRVLYWAQDSLDHVVVDGVEGPGYPSIVATSVRFSDGAHVSYMAQQNDRYFWVLDGSALRRYEWLGYSYYPGRPRLDRDGTQLTYPARADGRFFVVIGERETDRFDRIDSNPYFAPDGRVIFTATRGQRQYVGVDAAAFAFDWIAQAFITNAGRLVILAREGSMWKLFIDGVATGPAEPATGWVVASPDGRRIARMVQHGAKWHVLLDSVQGTGYDDLRDVGFSPDSRHVVYFAKRLDKWVAVVDGVESPPYDEIVVSHDRVAVVPKLGRASDESFTFLARRGREDFRVSIAWPRR